MTADRDRLARFAEAYASSEPPPWESGIVPPEVRALVEGAPALPPGRALDVGCGTGLSSVYLAQHGWRVIGVDWVAQAVAQARQRAAEAGLGPEQARFVRADVTAADFLAGEAPVGLWLDVGCLHGLPPAGRASYAAHVRRLLQPDGLLRMYVWRQFERDGRVLGVAPEEMLALFSPACAVVDVVLGQDEAGQSVRPSAWYTFRRVSEVS
ncbi:MAG: methyltransferase domain-containing protein [Anaerolineae bacterium]|nr:methyltransferase domain-containing protein [Anaerolineae bacterium]